MAPALGVLLSLLLLYTNCSKNNLPVLEKIIQEDLELASLSQIPSNNTIDLGELFKGGITKTDIKSYPVQVHENGYLDAGCLTNSEYDACIFYKNPVAFNEAPFSSYLTRGRDLTGLQVLGVQLTNRNSESTLTSSTIRVSATTGTAVTFNNGQARANYKTDGRNSWIAQLMAYYWLTLQELEFSKPERANHFYAQGKNIKVDAFSYDPENPFLETNAFYLEDDDRTTAVQTPAIVMGYATNSNTGTPNHEMALSAEIYLHEMGHANFDYATNSSIDISDTQITQYVSVVLDDQGTSTLADDDTKVQLAITECKTNQGCIDAINEGMADFHAILLLPNQTSLGETILNNTVGLTDSNITRDISKISSTAGVNSFFNPRTYTFRAPSNSTSKYTYTKCDGLDENGDVDCRALSIPAPKTGYTLNYSAEIHAVGILYNRILYDIYANPLVKRGDFEKIFSLHLSLLNANTRFPEAREALVTASKQLVGKIDASVNYPNIIRNAFNNRGVTP